MNQILSMRVAPILLVLLMAGCNSHRSEHESLFADVTTEESERDAVEQLIEKCMNSNARFTYSCHCENELGEQLEFDEATALAAEGGKVSVAVRLLDGNSFGPEDIPVSTVWHTFISAENLRRLLAHAFTFSEIGDPPPTK